MIAAIEKLNDIFIGSVYDYINRYLIDYCETAVKLINLHNETDQLLKAIKFEKDFEFCVVKFLFDSGYDMAATLETVNLLYLLPQVNKSDFSLEELKRQLLRFILQLSSTTRDTRNNNNADNKSIEQLEQSLSEIKIKLTNFSLIFCSLTVSFFNEQFFEYLDKDYSIFETSFLQNFHKNETFRVKSSIRTLDYMPTQMNYIWQWDCNEILVTPEYKYKDYANAVMKRKGMFNRFIAYIYTAKVPENERSKINDDNKHDVTVIPDRSYRTFTLQTLREYLESNNYYLNLVQYYNILSEVMVLVTIKEGRKIFKGIKSEMSNDNCLKYFRQDNRQIHRMRKTLLLFKTIFEKVFVNMKIKLHIDTNKNYHKKVYIRQTNALLEFFNISKNQTEQETKEKCFKIKKELGALLEPHIGDNHTDLKFFNYYYHGPVYTIFKVYLSV